jgi:hypothetical protein
MGHPANSKHTDGGYFATIAMRLCWLSNLFWCASINLGCAAQTQGNG